MVPITAVGGSDKVIPIASNSQLIAADLGAYRPVACRKPGQCFGKLENHQRRQSLNAVTTGDGGIKRART